MPSSRWLIPPTDPQAIRSLASELGVQPVTASVLVGRGLTDPDAARRFLTPDLGHLHDPLLLTGMRDAVVRIKAAIQAKEKILIYGDYDVDGTVSVVILKKAIEMAEPGDVVILAGKGHETYQILKDGPIPFDDREVARRVLRGFGYSRKKNGSA